jgi:hypothetical protein
MIFPVHPGDSPPVRTICQEEANAEHQGMEHGKRFVDGWGDRIVNQSPAIALNHRMLGT